MGRAAGRVGNWRPPSLHICTCITVDADASLVAGLAARFIDCGGVPLRHHRTGHDRQARCSGALGTPSARERRNGCTSRAGERLHVGLDCGDGFQELSVGKGFSAQGSKALLERMAGDENVKNYDPLFCAIVGLLQARRRHIAPSRVSPNLRPSRFLSSRAARGAEA